MWDDDVLSCSFCPRYDVLLDKPAKEQEQIKCSFQAHVQTHAIYLFDCRICNIELNLDDFRFENLTTVEEHLRSRHKHSVGKDFYKHVIFPVDHRTARCLLCGWIRSAFGQTFLLNHQADEHGMHIKRWEKPKDLFELGCRVCNRKFDDWAKWRLHFSDDRRCPESKGYVNFSRVLYTKDCPDGDNIEASRENLVPDFFCSVCQKDCLNLHGYKLHKASIEHRIALREAVGLTQFQPSASSYKEQPNEIYCDVCKIYTNDGKVSYEQHLNGKKHKLKLARSTINDPPDKCQNFGEAPNTKISPKVRVKVNVAERMVNHSLGIKRSQQPTETKSSKTECLPFRCGYCEILVENRDLFYKHIMTTGHNEKAKMAAQTQIDKTFVTDFDEPLYKVGRCPFCYVDSLKPDDLVQHINKDHLINLFRCSACPDRGGGHRLVHALKHQKVYHSAAEAKRQILLPQILSFRLCSQCDNDQCRPKGLFMEEPSSREASGHYLQAHPGVDFNNQKMLILCRMCENTFVEYSDFSEHGCNVHFKNFKIDA